MRYRGLDQPQSSQPEQAPVRFPMLLRHAWPLTLAASVLILSTAATPAYVSWVKSMPEHEATPQELALVTDVSADEIARAEDAASVADETTKKQAAASKAAAKSQRAEPEPRIVPSDLLNRKRNATPADRYEMANGCYALQSTTTDGWVVKGGSKYGATGEEQSAAQPFHFRATTLGEYLLWDSDEEFLRSSGEHISAHGTPNGSGVWVAQHDGKAFTFELRRKNGAGRALTVSDDGVLQARDTPERFRLALTEGCADWPEITTNVSGAPHKGETPFQEVRGYLDAHTHGMAFEFLGGSIHCGKPWHEYGVEYALVDCPDHSLTMGSGAVIENFMKGSSIPIVPHDPVGWPTFKDWPAPDSLTHEGTYFKWMERVWRSGQRLFVNLLVENNQLCMIYPLKRNSCDDMDAIRLQAKQMREFEKYIDAQWGGPGKGWYRIVTDPFEAREVANAGRLAVVMGIETSVPFGCKSFLDKAHCSEEDIDDNLDEVYDLGVRQVQLVNKFDNAMSGVAGDTGAAAILINAANFLETGSFWKMEPCDGEMADNEQIALPDQIPAQDALFAAVGNVTGITKLLGADVALPVYQAGPHCNARGLTSLGDHAIRGLVERKMMFDPDHMSVKARGASLDLIEQLKYPGILSSHSWADVDSYQRIYKAGGVITPYAGWSERFVEKWNQHLNWVDPRFYFGFGFGADINGLGAQGGARGADVDNPVKYPFKGLGGVMIDQQQSGQRVYDINVDGVAHYGLYPDWIEDLRQIAGEDIVSDMERGAEAYLQTWERSQGITHDACRDWSVAKPASTITGINKGASPEDVLRTAGQPHERIGTTFRYCAKDEAGDKTEVTVNFSKAGKVANIAAAAPTKGDKKPKMSKKNKKSASTNEKAASSGSDNTVRGSTTTDVDTDSADTGARGENGLINADSMPKTGSGMGPNMIAGLLSLLALGTLFMVAARARRRSAS